MTQTLMQPRFVYDVPSGMGGTFTVVIMAKLPDRRVRVRVIYPTADWNGYTFEIDAASLTNERRKRINVLM